MTICKLEKKRSWKYKKKIYNRHALKMNVISFLCTQKVTTSFNHTDQPRTILFEMIEADFFFLWTKSQICMKREMIYTKSLQKENFKHSLLHSTEYIQPYKEHSRRLCMYSVRSHQQMRCRIEYVRLTLHHLIEICSIDREWIWCCLN